MKTPGKRFLDVALLLFVLGTLQSSAVAQNGSSPTNHILGSLSEISNQDRALLVVLRSRVVSADQDNRDVLELVLRTDPEPRPRYRYVYGTIAKKLNKYIRKYRSLSAATQLSDADCVIFFNLVEYRRILNTFYPFGEIYIIVKGAPDIQKPPRVIWKSQKVTWAGDAVDEFIKELKRARREP